MRAENPQDRSTLKYFGLLMTVSFHLRFPSILTHPPLVSYMQYELLAASLRKHWKHETVKKNPKLSLVKYTDNIKVLAGSNSPGIE